ncbi:endonuclease VIII [Gracilimonas mengyeensis]|uniref:DNA-(apurinic or apyrimidinic site) lyase n=1 Tax=Gracilimonas mengyeensis TaxID=1302730 RepID=A0A521ARB6_9BACT|nr:endonuclease VIII [Gracilimonas mengyeensis]SMO37358.1 endonuclease-8 [Gracilimonas mengyeensis]
MPEGPEIWRAADTIKDAITGKKAESVFFAFEELKPYEEKLKGLKVESVTPRGKAILTSFEGDLNIYSHNQLYGKWIVSEDGEEPDNNRSLRLAIHTGEEAAFLYSASEIEILKDDEVEQHSYIQKLGPDVVHPDTTYEQVLQQYQSDDFKNRKLATLLLDQGFLSGLGNYLRSEIMFCAGIHPDYRPVDCREEQIKKLAKYSLELPRRSYETKGLVTSDDLIEALKREGATRKEYRFYVYGREGKPCYKCGRDIKVKKTGGRKIYYCENEQSANDKD